MKQMIPCNKSIDLFEILGNSLLAGLILAFFYYLHYYQPVAYVFFISEDSWSEYATFLLFLFSTLILLRTLIKDREFRKPGHFLFALATFLITMEEISWGQRIFNLPTPGFLQNLNTQNEISFHNIAQSKQYYPYIGTLLILGSMVLPILTKLSTHLRNFCGRWGIPIVSVRNWPFFVLAIFFLDHYSKFMQISLNKELAEVSLALAVSVVAMELVKKPGQMFYCNTSFIRTIKIIVITAICTIPLVLLFNDKFHIRYRLNYFSTTQYPLYGMYDQANQVFDYIDRHPKYLMNSTRYHHGLVLLRLGHNDEAKAILNKSLEEMEILLAEEPDNPEVYRNKGKILHLLRRNMDAKEQYLKSLELDLKLLSQTTDPVTNAEYRWSLGKTLFAMGRKEEANEQIQSAADITPSKSRRKKFLRWMKREQKKADRVMPSDLGIIDSDTISVPVNK